MTKKIWNWALADIEWDQDSDDNYSPSAGGLNIDNESFDTAQDEFEMD